MVSWTCLQNVSGGSPPQVGPRPAVVRLEDLSVRSEREWKHPLGVPGHAAQQRFHTASGTAIGAEHQKAGADLAGLLFKNLADRLPDRGQTSEFRLNAVPCQKGCNLGARTGTMRIFMVLGSSASTVTTIVRGCANNERQCIDYSPTCFAALVPCDDDFAKRGGWQPGRRNDEYGSTNLRYQVTRSAPSKAGSPVRDSQESRGPRDRCNA